MRIELSMSSDYEQTPEGWLGKAVAWADADEAADDQCIDGTHWEMDGDTAYAVLTVSGEGQYSSDAYADAFDELLGRLYNDGYEVDEDC